MHAQVHEELLHIRITYDFYRNEYNQTPYKETQ